MNPQELEIKLATLNGEILLAERKLLTIQTDIENHQASKTKALEEFEIIKKKKLGEIDVLMVELEGVMEVHTLYDDVILEQEERRDTAQKETTLIIQTATEKAQGIMAEAENAQKAVEDREQNVSIREENCTLAMDSIEGLFEEVEEHANTNILQTETLVEREKIVVQSEENSKEAIAQAQVLLDDIDRQLSEKRVEMQNLDITITEKTKIATETGKEVEARLTDVIRRENVVAGEERGLHDKHKELIQKELWLDDRETTVGRAYREVLQRGGTINGA